MVSNKTLYSFLGGIAFVVPANINSQGIVIESVSKFDGIFFTADTIEMLRKYQRLMLAILNGQRQTDGSYRGSYQYKNNFYGSRDLTKIELQLENQKNSLDPQLYAQEKNILNDLLQLILNDFEIISREFQDIIKESKAVAVGFVKESCLKHNREDSLLIQWSHADEGTEFDVFRKEVSSLKIFDQFCIDLFNFFSDLIESCPKAKQSFDNRIIKWKKVREVLEKIKQSGRVFSESEFLKYIKQNALDTLHNDTITTHTIMTLLETFERK